MKFSVKLYSEILQKHNRIYLIYSTLIVLKVTHMMVSILYALDIKIYTFYGFISKNVLKEMLRRAYRVSLLKAPLLYDV